MHLYHSPQNVTEQLTEPCTMNACLPPFVEHNKATHRTLYRLPPFVEHNKATHGALYSACMSTTACRSRLTPALLTVGFSMKLAMDCSVQCCNMSDMPSWRPSSSLISLTRRVASSECLQRNISTWGLRFSRIWIVRVQTSGTWRCVVGQTVPSKCYYLHT